MVESNHEHAVKAIKKSLKENVVSCEEAKTKMNRADTPITGKFQVFRICRSKDIIFIMDDPRCEDLDLKPVALGGLRGNFNGRIRRVGVVEGTLRSDVPIYRIAEEALGLTRVTGATFRFKK